MTTDQTPARDRLFALIASIPGSGTVDWCGPARALLDEIAAAVSVPPPADQTAPRDRIAEALYAHNHPGWATRYSDLDQDERDTYLARADAVLAVLPEQTDRAADTFAVIRPQTLTALASHIDARSVAILRPESQTYAEWQTMAALLRRVAAEEQPAAGCWCGHPQDRHWAGSTRMTFPDGCHDCRGWNGAHAYGQELPWADDKPDAERAAVGEQPETQETRLVELHVRYRVQLRHEGDADWKPSHPSLDYEDREDADESAALSRELYPRREYRVVIRTTTITEQP